MGTYVGDLKKADLKERNLRFYKLLGQNYEVLVNAILRGKDICYKIPDCYKLNTKSPYILEWLLDYGRPSEISQVRRMGPVKLKCIYNALESWVEKNPDDLDKWKYWEEWEEFFEKDKTQYKKKKVKEKKPVASEQPIEALLPELNWVTKKVRNHYHTDKFSDVYISISEKKSKEYKNFRLLFHFRDRVKEKMNTSGYLCFAVFENRIYFKESDSINGFRISSKAKNSKTITMAPSIKEEDIPKYEKFCGKELELKYDELYKLYYIEVEE